MERLYINHWSFVIRHLSFGQPSQSPKQPVNGLPGYKGQRTNDRKSPNLEAGDELNKYLFQLG